MSLSLIIVLLTAAPAPIKIAAPGLTVAQLDAALAETYTTSLAQQLTFRGLRVVTSSDMALVLGYKRQQQLNGCVDDACLATVATDLGVDALLAGQVARIDKTYRLDVRLLEPGSGKVLATASASANGNDQLVLSFATVAEQLANQLSAKLGRPLVPSEDAKVITRWSTIKKAGFIPLALGVASTGAGAVALILSRGQYDSLTSTAPNSMPLTPEAADRIVATGKTEQTLGWVGVGVGVGLLATATALFLFGGDETVSVGVAVTPSGASLGLTGSF